MKLFDNIKQKALSFLGINGLQNYMRGTIYGSGTMAASWQSLKADEYYSKVPELYGIIERKVAMFIKVEIEFKNRKNETVEHPFLKLLERPNQFESKKEFKKRIYRNYSLTGISWLYIDFGGLMDSRGRNRLTEQTQIYCFSTSDLTFYENKKNVKPAKWQDMFTRITAKVPWSTSELVLDLNNLYFWTESGTSFMNVFSGSPKIQAAWKALDNLLAAYDSENVMLTKRGGGVFSQKVSKDSEYNTPIQLSKTDQDEFNEKLKSFNLGTMAGQNQYIQVPASFDYIDLMRTPQQLGLAESFTRNKTTICDVFNFPILMLNSLDGATFSNMDAVQSSVYENVTIPDVEAFIDFIKDSFMFDAIGEFSINTSAIQSLAADTKMQAETAQLNTNIIISLNSAVFEGKMTKETAINVLISQGFDVNTANLLINEKTVSENGNNQT